VAINRGTATPSAYKLGSTSVSKVYLGTSRVWPVASAFTPMAVLLTSGTSYTVPSGATSMKAWAVGSASGGSTGGAGGTAYKTWTVSGGSSVAYAVGPLNSGQAGGNSTVTYGGVTITGRGGTSGGSTGGGTYSGGDGGANGGKGWNDCGGAVGGNYSGSTTVLSCTRVPAADVSGLLAAVALAGGKRTEDCGSVAAFGSGGGDKYNLNKGPGYGGGAGHNSTNGVGGAVVLYFT